MPCVEKTPKDIDAALQILNIIRLPNNVNDGTNHPVREVTQTDHLNKRLLKTFLEHLNVTAEVPINNDKDEDGRSHEFVD